MKSNERTEREFRALEDIWEACDFQSLEGEVCSLVYHALRWARGLLRENAPSFALKQWIEKRKKETRTAAAELEQRRHVGGALANIAFNLAQKSEVLSQHDRDVLTEWRKRWDAIQRYDDSAVSAPASKPATGH